MKRAEVLELLEEFKQRISKTDCGAILMISTSTDGAVDVDVASNLDASNQLKLYQSMIARLRGAQ